jgi:hypothetical protein
LFSLPFFFNERCAVRIRPICLNRAGCPSFLYPLSISAPPCRRRIDLFGDRVIVQIQNPDHRGDQPAVRASH